MQDPRLINNQEKLKSRRYLRQNETKAEYKLWELLKNRKLLGIKFRRQVSIGPYIADFFSFEINLVIEVDGVDHFTEQGKTYDQERSDFFNSQGIKTIRFTNSAVLNDIEKVTEILKDKIREWEL